MLKLKPVIIICAILFLFVSRNSNCSSTETLSVTFVTSSSGGHFKPNHCVAVWLEDSSGNFIRTLGRWAGIRWHSLRDWQESSGFDTDAVSGATQKEYGILSTENIIESIPDGKYIIRFELAEDENPSPGKNNTASIPFLKNGIRSLNNPPEQGGFTSISISYSGRETSVNYAPGVFAGPDNNFSAGETCQLHGVVSDDTAEGKIETAWSVVSGAGNIRFRDSSSPQTSAEFSDPGIYILRLTADDGTLQSSDEVTITINTIVLESVGDSEVQSGNPDKNQNGDFRIRVFNQGLNKQSEGFIKFDLSTISGEILSSKLRLSLNDFNSDAKFRNVMGMFDDSWSADSITWNNKPSEGMDIGSFNAAYGWIKIDVTQYLTSEYAEDGRISFRIYHSKTDKSFLRFNAQETFTGSELLIILK